MQSYIVDVFAERPLAGNQLAVILDAGELDTATMQAIARETNFSETTFVTQHNEDRASVRIFTPDSELSFAGHPTLGTAWVLCQQSEPARTNITLELGVGDVSVSQDSDTGILWLQSPKAELSEGIAVDQAAQLLGLQEADFLAEYPIQAGELGPRFQIIAVRSLDALAACRIEPTAFEQFLQGRDSVEGLFVFTTNAHSEDADYAARMFFDAFGPREDPATGSANCCFAAYLQQIYQGPFTAVVDQGVEMGRASKIYLDVGDSIRVGGRVQQVFCGKLTL